MENPRSREPRALVDPERQVHRLNSLTAGALHQVVDRNADLDLASVGALGGVNQRVVGPHRVGELRRRVEHPNEGPAGVCVAKPLARGRPRSTAGDAARGRYACSVR